MRAPSFWWKFLAVVGGGTAATFLALPSALATEDESGEDVPSKDATPPPGAATTPAVRTAPSAIPGKPAPELKQAPPATPRTLGVKAVEVLSRDIGAAEQPPSSNRGPRVDQIIRGVYGGGEKYLGKAWCARALRYAFEKAAQELGRPAPFAAVSSALAAVSDWASTFKSAKSKDPAPGMVALIQHGGISHATLVANVKDGFVYTVEGNHNDSVATVRRAPSAFDGFYDIDAWLANRPHDLVAGIGCLGEMSA